MIPDSQLQLLMNICDLPTAPFREEYVIAAVEAWAAAPHRAAYLDLRRDPAGNLHLHYRRAGKNRRRPPLVLEAHMDHPGFELTAIESDGSLIARFLGGVRPSHFTGATAAFWSHGAWIATPVLEVQQAKQGLRVHLAKPPEPLAVGSLGMWHLPDARVEGNLLAARVCDDLAGVAAALCTLDELIRMEVAVPMVVLLTRAEEVGFAGALAAAIHGWVHRGARIIGLETSKAQPAAPQGAGAIVRVGDRSSLFAHGLTHFVCQSAGHLGDQHAEFRYQRKLMEGGTCNTTAFCAFGYEATGACLALGNYHNMSIEGEPGWGNGAKAGPGIASETIDLGDFAGLVEILVETAQRYPNYRTGAIRQRLEKLYWNEHAAMLGDGRQARLKP